MILQRIHLILKFSIFIIRERFYIMGHTKALFIFASLCLYTGYLFYCSLDIKSALRCYNGATPVSRSLAPSHTKYIENPGAENTSPSATVPQCHSATVPTLQISTFQITPKQNQSKRQQLCYPRRAMINIDIKILESPVAKKPIGFFSNSVLFCDFNL